MVDPANSARINSLSDDVYLARVCRCIDDCENGEYNSTCILKNNAKCYRKLEIVDGLEIETAGCLSSLEVHIDQCNKAAEPKFDVPTDYKCCWDTDLCNDHLHMEVNLPEPEQSDPNIAITLIISFVLAVTVAILLIIAFCFRFRQKEKRRKRQLSEKDVLGLDKKKLGDIVDQYSTPGACSSGSGMPLLVQRTIARQIEIIRELGAGRYGTVMLGKWRDEYVAVKMFNSRDEDSWYRETEIYQTVLLRHENILCFVASDINGTGSWTELYLITDYHENGSLHDYLQNLKFLDLKSALKLAYTAACGLAHLHTEIIGTQGKISNQGKPAIAHRDIKSKNILVKKDGTCCIADMGLAVKYSSSKDNGKGELNKGRYKRSCRQGTKRYMAPEVLSARLLEDSFDAFKASDIYSFALVLWEILNCILVEDAAPEYHLPYYDVVRNDPDFEEMRKVVDIDEIRPEVSPAHANHPTLSRYVEMMKESWTARPESRLTSLRIRKTLRLLWNEPLSNELREESPFTDDRKQMYEYASDRSNSSGYPTNVNFYHNEHEKSFNQHRLNGHSVNRSLISNQYSDSC